MNNIVTFSDKKCCIPKCNNIVDWHHYNLFNGVCDSHQKKYSHLEYCYTCQEIRKVYDIVNVPMCTQHVSDWRCTRCNHKPVKFLDAIQRSYL